MFRRCYISELNISMYGHRTFGTPKGDEGRASWWAICLLTDQWQDLDADQTRNRNRRRKNRSGIPGMGQYWQSALKIRVIMIPLPKNTAAGAASGVCCSGKGCCKVSGSHCRAVLAYSGLHRGRENQKTMAGEAQDWHCQMCFSAVACGNYLFTEKGF